MWVLIRESVDFPEEAFLAPHEWNTEGVLCTGRWPPDLAEVYMGQVWRNLETGTTAGHGAQRRTHSGMGLRWGHWPGITGSWEGRSKGWG